jgi:hypothetical protein
VELGLEADRAVIDLGGDRQLWYSKSVLVHVTNTARMHVSKRWCRMMRRPKALASQVVDITTPEEYAFYYFLLLHNMTIHGDQVKTPYEFCSGRKPDLSRLRTFGCRVMYVEPPRPVQTSLPASIIGVEVRNETKYVQVKYP